MSDEIKYDDSARRAGRWATAMSIFGLVGILIFAAFANQFSPRLGIPIWFSYSLAGLGGTAVVLLNWGVQNLSTITYGWLVVGFIMLAAIQTTILCIFSYVDDGSSAQSLGSIGSFAIIFILTTIVTWRLNLSMWRGREALPSLDRCVS
ncbi:MAG: hypothetical protein FWD68_07605 [Alphaproteobacteria bacterium]|nr:hypothetical protein [Alphaproteobacteria bacterium]